MSHTLLRLLLMMSVLFGFGIQLHCLWQMNLCDCNKRQEPNLITENKKAAAETRARDTDCVVFPPWQTFIGGGKTPNFCPLRDGSLNCSAEERQAVWQITCPGDTLFCFRRRVGVHRRCQTETVKTNAKSEDFLFHGFFIKSLCLSIKGRAEALLNWPGVLYYLLEV